MEPKWETTWNEYWDRENRKIKKQLSNESLKPKKQLQEKKQKLKLKRNGFDAVR